MATLAGITKTVASKVPAFQVFVEVPERPQQVAQRTHNAWSRAAMRQILETHHKKRIPEHFKRSARGKYGYKNRKPRYMRYKARKYGSQTDLVFSGASKINIERNPKFVVAGAAEGGKKPIEGRIEVEFQWQARRRAALRASPALRKKAYLNLLAGGRANTGVKTEDMKSEVRRILPNEASEMGIEFLHEYMKRYKNHPSQRRTYSSRKT